MKRIRVFFILVLLLTTASLNKNDDPVRYWMKIKAQNKFERSVVTDMGVAIEAIRDEYVYAIGNWDDLQTLQSRGWVEVSFPLDTIHAKAFPDEDKEYHDYAELTKKLQDIHAKFPEITTLTSIGKSVEGRDIWALRVSGNLKDADNLPASIFMGGHHAREHLSVETPLRIMEEILKRYEAQDARIQVLLESRDIHFIPAVNPDGLEYDVTGSSYKYWRKNRSRNNDGSYGVDLNRNYGWDWGTGGASKSPGSEIYMGPAPFSEPETRAIRDYVDAHKNLTVLLSFHTFSELVLYPWGSKYEGIGNSADRQVHEVMAKKMTEWNGYHPEQASEMYIASGDTCDWSYGQHRIISFTFELDPSGYQGADGFYPGAGVIQEVVQKNYNPVLYLIEYSDNPYRVLSSGTTPVRP
jgi:carboxypeptidase T